MKYRITLLLAALLGLLLGSCDKADDIDGPNEYTEATYTVAVIMPTENSSNLERWKRTAAWALENMRRAQDGLPQRVYLNVEWIAEEDATDPYHLDHVGQELASRDDVKIVIGPSLSQSVDTVARYLNHEGKMMISPTATSAEVLRKYSSKGFFWALCEPDITQCEVLLNKAQGYGAQTVALMASNSAYGKTFLDWFAFQAQEMGMDVIDIFSLEEQEDALRSQADYVICVPDAFDDVISLQETANGISASNCSPVLYSDLALDHTLTSYGMLTERMEGVSPYADPASGFEISYSVRFGTKPTFEEVQLYDALMLSFLVLSDYNRQLAEGATFDDSTKVLNSIMSDLMVITDDNGQPLPRVFAWTTEGMQQVLRNPRRYNISGASGNLDFDTELQGPVKHSVYTHWMIYNQKIITLDFLSSQGSSHTGSTTAAWKWRASVMQDIADATVPIDYAPLHDQWAVLVCGSRGWYNYRHQSDVLNMYALLRQGGMPRDHIIVVATPDDIISSSSNLHAGEIRSTIGGSNIYEPTAIDYSADSLTVSDIADILQGESSPHLPRVLHTDDGSNVLLYWSGHGEDGKFLWGYTSNHFTSEMLREVVSGMYEAKRFRKMLICGEPCYSGSVLNAIEGIPGVLAISSANTKESSFADIFDAEMGVWLSDRFTNSLVYTIGQRPSQSFHDLYLYLVQNTYGSHVGVLNYAQFDNLYRSSPEEFFVAH